MTGPSSEPGRMVCSDFRNTSPTRTNGQVETVLIPSRYSSPLRLCVGGNKKSGRAARGVQHGFRLFRVDDLNHEINDVARRAELPGIALGPEDAEEILECVAETFTVVIVEFVGHLVRVEYWPAVCRRGKISSLRLRAAC